MNIWIIIGLTIFTLISTFIYYKYDLQEKNKVKHLRILITSVFLINGSLIFLPYIVNLFQNLKPALNNYLLFLIIYLIIVIIFIFIGIVHNKKIVKKRYNLPTNDLVFIKLVYIIFYIPIILFDIYRNNLSSPTIILIIAFVLVITGLFVLRIKFSHILGRVFIIIGSFSIIVFTVLLTLSTDNLNSSNINNKTIISKIVELDTDYSSENITKGFIDLKCDRLVDYTVYDNKLFLSVSEVSFLKIRVQIRVYDLENGNLLKTDIVNPGISLYSLKFEVSDNKLYYMDNLGTFLWQTDDFTKISDLNATNSRFFIANNGHLSIAELIDEDFIQIWELVNENFISTTSLDYTDSSLRISIDNVMGNLIIKTIGATDFYNYNTSKTYDYSELPDENYFAIAVINDSLIISDGYPSYHVYKINSDGTWSDIGENIQILGMDKVIDQYYSKSLITDFYQKSYIYDQNINHINSYRGVYLYSQTINFKDSMYMLRNFDNDYYYIILNPMSNAITYFEYNKLVLPENKAFSHLTSLSVILISLIVLAPFAERRKQLFT